MHRVRWSVVDSTDPRGWSALADSIVALGGDADTWNGDRNRRGYTAPTIRATRLPAPDANPLATGGRRFIDTNL